MHVHNWSKQTQSANRGKLRKFSGRRFQPQKLAKVQSFWWLETGWEQKNLRFFKRFLPCKIGGSLREAMTDMTAMTAMKTWGVVELWHRDPEVGMTCGWWKGCWGEWYRGKLCGGVFASLRFSCALGIRWKTRKTQVASGNYLDVLWNVVPYHPLPGLRFRICSVPVWIPTLPGGAWPGVRFHGLRLSRSSHVAGRTFPVLIAGTAFSRWETLSILSLWSSDSVSRADHFECQMTSDC